MPSSSEKVVEKVVCAADCGPRACCERFLSGQDGLLKLGDFGHSQMLDEIARGAHICWWHPGHLEWSSRDVPRGDPAHLCIWCSGE